MVTKLVMTTSSVGIIIMERNSPNTRFFPLKLQPGKGVGRQACSPTTMAAVVMTEKIRVFSR